MHLEDKGNIFDDWLESPQGLLLAFCPRILEGGKDLRIIFFLENECSLSSVDNHWWWTLLAGKKIEHYALSSSGDAPSTSASTPYEPPGGTFTT